MSAFEFCTPAELEIMLRGVQRENTCRLKGELQAGPEFVNKIRFRDELGLSSTLASHMQ